jgi:S-adenosylmethionine synthetase
MSELTVEAGVRMPAHRLNVEYVERKGLGHPDSMCDAMMEAISVALSAEYLRIAGRVMHHNIDKGLLVAGQTTPRLGGGTVDAPMRLVIGDRATDRIDGHEIPVGEIAETAARQWLKEHLRFVDPQAHLIVQNELRPGSAELQGIYGAGSEVVVLANDTSVGVGFAPYTETEQLVREAERCLNSAEFKQQFPESGEDVKVMGVRRGKALFMTVAVAIVDRFLRSTQEYVERKAAILNQLRQHLNSRLRTIDSLELQLNTLDDPVRGPDGLYLSVLGTSAECGDGGQVGRGNRVSGLISLSRPMTLEAAAGKNPVHHVGKVYNLLAQHTAQRIAQSLDAIDEVYIWFCSQIGRPVAEPWFASAQVALKAGASLADVETPLRQIVAEELRGTAAFSARLIRGELPIC